jgi:hypothetical protein
VRLIVQIQAVRHQLFQLDFRWAFEARTPAVVTATIITTRSAFAPFAIRPRSAPAFSWTAIRRTLAGRPAFAGFWFLLFVCHENLACRV